MIKTLTDALKDILGPKSDKIECAIDENQFSTATKGKRTAISVQSITGEFDIRSSCNIKRPTPLMANVARKCRVSVKIKGSVVQDRCADKPFASSATNECLNSTIIGDAS